MLLSLAGAWPLLLTLSLAAAVPLALMPLLGRRRRLGAGTHVLITGGSKGLGLALARLCVERGCAVTVVARSQADLDEARRQLEAAAAASTAARAGRGGGAADAQREPPKVQALSADTADPEKVGRRWVDVEARCSLLQGGILALPREPPSPAHPSQPSAAAQGVCRGGARCGAHRPAGLQRRHVHPRCGSLLVPAFSWEDCWLEPVRP